MASRMVAGPSCRMFLSPGLLTRYALCRPRLMARGQVRCLRPGLRFLFLVMSAMTPARAARACSGGESRADGPADDAQGALELDPVRVDPGAGGGGADQGAERVVGQQVAQISCSIRSGLPGRSTLPGPRRHVLSWALPVSCSQRWW